MLRADKHRALDAISDDQFDVDAIVKTRNKALLALICNQYHCRTHLYPVCISVQRFNGSCVYFLALLPFVHFALCRVPAAVVWSGSQPFGVVFKQRAWLPLHLHEAGHTELSLMTMQCFVKIHIPVTPTRICSGTHAHTFSSLDLLRKGQSR